jgi:triosephosphate isomerase
MFSDLKITPPFFELGPKAYLYGEAAWDLALFADHLCGKYQVQIIYTPQYMDIPVIARQVRDLMVFAQHMDSLEIGRGVGSVLPEALKAAGASGVLLNHSEKPIPVEEIGRTIRRADEVGLASMVCAGNLIEVEAYTKLKPNIILAEAPELIGVGKRKGDDRLVIQTIDQLVQKINKDVLVLHGAGISDEKDVYRIIAAGAQGTGSTSGVILAQDPKEMLEKMIRSVKEAWDKFH